MIQRRGTFFLGIFIFLIPFLGLPTFWKTMFICFSGLVLVFLSIKIDIRVALPEKPVKPLAKPVLKKVRTKKEKTLSVTIDSIIPHDVEPLRKLDEIK